MPMLPGAVAGIGTIGCTNTPVANATVAMNQQPMAVDSVVPSSNKFNECNTGGSNLVGDLTAPKERPPSKKSSGKKNKKSTPRSDITPTSSSDVGAIQGKEKSSSGVDTKGGKWKSSSGVGAESLSVLPNPTQGRACRSCTTKSRVMGSDFVQY